MSNSRFPTLISQMASRSGKGNNQRRWGARGSSGNHKNKSSAPDGSSGGQKGLKLTSKEEVARLLKQHNHFLPGVDSQSKGAVERISTLYNIFKSLDSSILQKVEKGETLELNLEVLLSKLRVIREQYRSLNLPDNGHISTQMVFGLSGHWESDGDIAGSLEAGMYRFIAARPAPKVENIIKLLPAEIKDAIVGLSQEFLNDDGGSIHGLLTQKHIDCLTSSKEYDSCAIDPHSYTGEVNHMSIDQLLTYKIKQLTPSKEEESGGQQAGGEGEADGSEGDTSYNGDVNLLEQEDPDQETGPDADDSASQLGGDTGSMISSASTSTAMTHAERAKDRTVQRQYEIKYNELTQTLKPESSKGSDILGSNLFDAPISSSNKTMSMESFDFECIGKVQKVRMRKFVKRKADELGITG